MLNYTLATHPRDYTLTPCEAVVSLIVPIEYAKRHWECGHRFLGGLYCIPFIGSLGALVERIVVWASKFFSDNPYPLFERYRQEALERQNILAPYPRLSTNLPREHARELIRLSNFLFNEYNSTSIEEHRLLDDPELIQEVLAENLNAIQSDFQDLSLVRFLRVLHLRLGNQFDKFILNFFQNKPECLLHLSNQINWQENKWSEFDENLRLDCKTRFFETLSHATQIQKNQRIRKLLNSGFFRSFNENLKVQIISEIIIHYPESFYRFTMDEFPNLEMQNLICISFAQSYFTDERIIQLDEIPYSFRRILTGLFCDTPTLVAHFNSERSSEVACKLVDLFRVIPSGITAENVSINLSNLIETLYLNQNSILENDLQCYLKRYCSTLFPQFEDLTELIVSDNTISLIHIFYHLREDLAKANTAYFRPFLYLLPLLAKRNENVIPQLQEFFRDGQHYSSTIQNLFEQAIMILNHGQFSAEERTIYEKMVPNLLGYFLYLNTRSLTKEEYARLWSTLEYLTPRQKQTFLKGLLKSQPTNNMKLISYFPKLQEFLFKFTRAYELYPVLSKCHDYDYPFYRLLIQDKLEKVKPEKLLTKYLPFYLPFIIQDPEKLSSLFNQICPDITIYERAILQVDDSLRSPLFDCWMGGMGYNDDSEATLGVIQLGLTDTNATYGQTAQQFQARLEQQSIRTIGDLKENGIYTLSQFYERFPPLA